MIKAIIFDLDNTLLDFVKMKQFAVKAAITAMNEAGLGVDEEKAYKDIMDLYVTTGWENQLVFDDYLKQTKGEVSNKILAAGVVAYHRAREATLLVYPNVNKTLIEQGSENVSGIIGSDLLKKGKGIIDYSSNRLFLKN